MKAAVLYEGKEVKIEEVIEPQLESMDVLVKVKYSGVCGSDLPRVLNNGAHYYPIVLGHEFSGEIVEIGSEVKDRNVGDKVSCIPLIPCMKCEDCENGNYSQCKHYKFIGSRIQGAWAEYIKIPAKNAFVVPKEMGYLEAAFFEPLTVGLHGLKLFNYCKGKKVAILGAGTIGLLTLQACVALDAKEVDVYDVDEKKLSLAQKMGAAKGINTTELTNENMISDYDLVIETAGVPATFKLCLKVAGNKGEVLFIGTPHVPLTFEVKEFEMINRKELTVKGSWMNYSKPFPGEEWDIASKLFMDGKINVELLIDRVVTLEQFPIVFKDFENRTISGKVLIGM